MKINKLSLAVSASILAMTTGQATFAQGGKDVEVEEVIITGTSVARSSFDTPLSATQFDEDDYRRLSASSNADLLRQVPGISAEGGGGEVAVNLFVRGLPSAGQYSFTPLNYDGYTTFSYFGLNSSAFDVYHRPDLGIERVEFVRGGVSNLFGPGSVAGVVNYISKTGSDTPESTIQFEVAEDNRMKADFATSGPLGGADSNNYYALSGYYRYDEGPVESGLETEGYQIKGNFKREFEDGSGEFVIHGQYIDDKVQFFLPLTMNGDSFVDGNDGQEIRTNQTGAVDEFSFPRASGRYHSDIGDGVTARGGSLGFTLEKELENGWGITSKTKYSKYSHQFNLFITGNGVQNAAETQQEYLEARGLSGFTDAQFTYTNSGGQVLEAGDRLFENRVFDRDRPADDFTTDFAITKSAGIHNFTGGFFFSRANADDINNNYRYLGEFNDQPRLVDLTLVSDDPNTVEDETLVYSLNGYTGMVGRSNAGGSANRQAIYFADQIEEDRWALDFGLRVERFDGEYFSEGSENQPVPNSENYYTNLQSTPEGNGVFNRADVDLTAWAGAISGLYRLTDTWNVYGNLSRGFFIPQLRSLRFNGGQVGPFEEETVVQAELGVKFSSTMFEGSIALFNVNLDDRQSVSTIDDPDNPGNTIFQVDTLSTSAQGIEANVDVSLTDNFTVDFGVTVQDHEFDEGANEGNEISRQPKLLGSLGLVYDNEAVDASLYFNHRGDSFGDNGNNNELEAFTMVRLDAGYTFDMGRDETLRLSVGVFNLTDESGLTEGNPRSASGAGGIARPVLPRRVSLRATYSF